jgi:hypothetical protein
MLYTVLLDPEAGYYLGNSMYRSFDKNLACGNEMNLDCYEVTAITGDFNMTIITLGSHYSMLFC